MKWFRRPAATTDPVAPRIRYAGRPAAYLPGAWEIPVVVVAYFPVRGGRIDRAITGDIDATLDGIRAHTRAATERIVEALETGSVYHGYANPGAAASLRYRVVETLEILEPLPTWRKPGHSTPMTDYRAIIERVGGRELVEERGVKEFWVWGYHGGVVDLWESNMAGPFGDISNSDRDPDDLPVFDRTYTVYHYNYGRGASEAVEDHMHQIEAVLRNAGEELFWERFVGGGKPGHCGWSHYPPNGRRDYDWANPTMVETDIEDWRPDGSGERLRLNCDRWGGDSLTWFTYWMQNLPGAGNSLDWRGRAPGNWWRFIGDFDAAMRAGGQLVQ